MSTSEYNDLFLKSQNTGKYHVFTFDIKNSRTLENRGIIQENLIKMILNIYKRLKEKEQNENKKILVFEKDFVNIGEKTPGFGLKQEPFILGDVVGLTTYRDSISNEEVLEIFLQEKDKLNLNVDFNIADGYYETNIYEEGNIKYFRGYCIDLLTNLHKEKNREIRNKLLEKRK